MIWANPTPYQVKVAIRGEDLGKVHSFVCEPGDMVEIPDAFSSAVAIKAPQLVRADAATQKPKAEMADSAPDADASEADPFTGEPKHRGAKKR